MIEIDESLATAEVYGFTRTGDFYQVKVSLPDIGTYITGIRVKDSIHSDKSPWVQMPSYKVNNDWHPTIEFSNSSPMRELIHKLALEAVSAHESGNNTKPTHRDRVYEPSDEELNNLAESLDKSFEELEQEPP